jgi:hypothetical protein
MSAWTVISHVEVPSGGQASIDFNSISSSYTDLLLLVSLRSTRASGSYDLYRIQVNGTNNLTSGRTLEGAGSGTPVSESRIEAGVQPISLDTASTFGNGLHYIPNYAGSTNKVFSGDSVAENNGTEAGQLLTAGIYNNSSAITSLKLVSSIGDFVQYSSATLYGITKGSSGGVVVS